MFQSSPEGEVFGGFAEITRDVFRGRACQTSTPHETSIGRPQHHLRRRRLEHAHQLQRNSGSAF